MSAYARVVAAPVLALMFLSSCSLIRQSSGARAERTVVTVENQGFSDVTIYAVDGPHRHRVGIANGHSTSTLVLRASTVAGGRMLRFLCDPIGSEQRTLSQEIFIEPGDRLTLTIPVGERMLLLAR